MPEQPSPRPRLLPNDANRSDTMAWKRGSWRDGILGGFLIFVLPVLIVIVAAI